MSNFRTLTLPPALQSALNRGQTWWHQRPARERGMLSIAAALLMCCIVWYGLLNPAIQTLRNFDKRYNAQQAQWQSMLLLQEEARKLQKAPPIEIQNPMQALQTLTQAQLGSKATLSPQGAAVLISINGVSTNALGSWLRAAREQVHALPQEAQLQSTPQGWQGRLTMAIKGNE